MSRALPSIKEIEEMSNELAEIFVESGHEQNIAISKEMAKEASNSIVNALVEAIKSLGLSFIE